jgi:hypothetical protein
MVAAPAVGEVEQLAADDQGAGHVDHAVPVVRVDLGHPHGQLGIGGGHDHVAVAQPLEQVLEAALLGAGDVAVQRHAGPGVDLGHMALRSVR